MGLIILTPPSRLFSLSFIERSKLPPGLPNLATTMSSQPLLSAPPTKRIALPVRVEPKVFFANERTFLSWLNFSILLGGLAIGLLNFSHDKPGQVAAGLFTAVAILSMFYALVTFHWRARSSGVRGQGGFDDRYGPTGLALLLVVAVGVNLGMRIGAEKNK